MALPQRNDSPQHAPAHAEPMVEVAYDDSFSEQEHTSPWCVDHGDAITVMSTRQIRAAVSNGKLSMAKKAWRDGNACWLEIAEWPELTAGTEVPLALVASGDDGPAWGSDDEYDIPESGVRRIQRSLLDSEPLPLVPTRDVLRASSLMQEPSGFISSVSLRAAAVAFSAVVLAAGCLTLGAYLSDPPAMATLTPVTPALLAPLRAAPAVAAAAYAPGQVPAASEVPVGFRGRLR
jgi:hypothetical protein